MGGVWAGLLAVEGFVYVDKRTGFTQDGFTGDVGLFGPSGAEASRFVTSWSSGGASEAITIKAWITPEAIIGTPRPNWRVEEYDFDVYVDSGSGRKLTSTPCSAPVASPSAWMARGSNPVKALIASCTFTVTGPMVGAVHVEFRARVSIAKQGGGPGTSFTQTELVAYGITGAHLVSGAGMVALTAGQSDKIQEGTIVSLDVVSGFGNWRLDVFDGTGARVCDTSRFPWSSTIGGTSASADCGVSREWSGQKDGRFEIKIPTGVFRADGKNVWKVKLSNTLVAQSAERFFVVDQAAKAPEVPKVEVSNPKPVLDETVTLRWWSRPNPLTNAPIGHFLLYVWYGTPNQPPSGDAAWVADGARVEARALANGTYEGSYSFAVKTLARLQWRAVAVDGAGRISGSTINATDARDLSDAGLTNPNTNARGTITPKGADTSSGLKEPGSAPAAPFDRNMLLVVLAALAASIAFWTWGPRRQRAPVLGATWTIIAVWFLIVVAWGVS